MGALDVLCLVVVGCASGASAYGFADAMDVATLRALLESARTDLGRVTPAGARRAQARRSERVVRELPAFLDIVTLGLSAGLSFDASLELYCERYDTELSAAVGNAMLGWRMGYRGRGEALAELAAELDVAPLRRFAATVTEALAFGTPLAEALTRQAQTVRDEQRAQVEEEIERVPVRMLIPLGTLIVPAMLLAILGPLLGPALALA